MESRAAELSSSVCSIHAGWVNKHLVDWYRAPPRHQPIIPQDIRDLSQTSQGMAFEYFVCFLLSSPGIHYHAISRIDVMQSFSIAHSLNKNLSAMSMIGRC